MSATLFDPPDVDHRTLIETAFDVTLLVEAAAGTGKTTSMIRRMVGLLAAGHCRVEAMAAVTFTRKATAELRARFAVELERSAHERPRKERERLLEALEHVEHCFIGTIHSFCARLLRERPIEAGVDIGFEELDEDAEFRLRMAAWDEYVAHLHAREDPLLAELDDLGLALEQLREPYREFADYPDVETWPAEIVEIDPDRLERARVALLEICAHAESMAPALWGMGAGDRSRLMSLYLDLPARARSADLRRPRDLIDVLEECAAVKPRTDNVKVTKWPQSRQTGYDELERWTRFHADHAAPLTEWRIGRRYEPALRVLKGAAAHYARMRADRGVLSYQDLLMRSADLLRDRPNVRRYFRRRFSHLLVDEFQDTDPVQAAVMMLLTADDDEERDWRACRPVNGSLFVVGDPKQSIYRFRRADIVTYNEVQRIIAECGRVVELTANFRSLPVVIEWVNRASAELFPEAANHYAPCDRPMDAARPTVAGDREGVWRLPVPDACSRLEDIEAWEAAAIARAIRIALDAGHTVARRDGTATPVVPGDFLILTWTRDPLVKYATRLQEQGIPVDVTGGKAVNEVEEVALLHTALAAAVEPDDPVALVGALRSPLFGVSDTKLYRFRRAGGRFDLRVGDDVRALDDEIGDALRRLRDYSIWLSRVPAVAAVERMIDDLGLPARAVTAPGGTDRAGGLCKAMELLRSTAREHWTPAALADYLRMLVDPEHYPPERHDGVSVRPHAESAVRIMNLHQAKGLEAPIVFLAEGGRSGKKKPVRLHVDRLHGEVRGFLQVLGPKRGWVQPLLAAPTDWEDHEREERRFREAERDRLLYVAGTRAGAQLIASHPAGVKHHQWDTLLTHVPVERVCPEPPEVAPPESRTETLADDAPRDFDAALRERRAAIRRPTYEVKAVKAATVKSRRRRPGGEHGTEWGTVLHTLLEAAMVDADADLTRLAVSALETEGLTADLADTAVETVRAVTTSDLWARARGSVTCLPEVPIETLEPGDDGDVIMRGVIDLVFREDDGWVIVDYKTDDRGTVTDRSAAPERGGETPLDELVEHYRPQVQAYAKAWARLTGEPVREAGLFFVHTRTYRTLEVEG